MDVNFARIVKMRDNPETSRVGMKWTTEEDTQLMESVYNQESFADIATTLKRTKTAIRSRIIQHAIVLMKSENITTEEVSKRVHISEDEIIAYKMKQDEKATTKKPSSDIKSPQTDDKYMTLLTEIRDLLKIIAEK